MNNYTIVDGWRFEVVKVAKNSLILEKEGQLYKVNKRSLKLEKCKKASSTRAN